MREQALGLCIFLLCGAGLLAYLYEPAPISSAGPPSLTAEPGMGGASASSPEHLTISLPGSTRSSDTPAFTNPHAFSLAPLALTNQLVGNSHLLASHSETTVPVTPAPELATSNRTANVAKAVSPARPEAIPAQSVEELTPTPEPKPEAAALAPVHNTGPGDGKRIAITFDDGPHPVFTYRILDELRAKNIKATFFVLGNNARRYPWILQQIIAEGHEIGNHSYSHGIFSTFSNEKIEQDLSQCQEVIKEAIGYEPSLFRPPYGEYRTNTREISQRHHLNIILWSVDPRDWRIHDEERIYHDVTSHVRNGSIILCHDNHPATIKALPRIFDTLQTEGYQFTTVSELCGLTSTTPKSTNTVSFQ